MSKKALILYWHGLGDVIMLTPILRHLHQRGYKTHLMCRPEVHSSNLLGDCPYVNLLIYVSNPWQSDIGFDCQSEINISMFKDLYRDYDWSACCFHKYIKQGCKIATNWHECGLTPDNDKLEVFIPPNIEAKAMKLISFHYPKGYIYKHTQIEFHETHNWDCTNWMKKHLPNLPIVDTGLGGNYYCADPDINFSFVLAREATHRVLSSSVFVHACEAMGVKMDVINYGRPDRKVWPKNQDLVIRIREAGRWIK